MAVAIVLGISSLESLQLAVEFSDGRTAVNVGRSALIDELAGPCSGLVAVAAGAASVAGRAGSKGFHSGRYRLQAHSRSCVSGPRWVSPSRGRRSMHSRCLTPRLAHRCCSKPPRVIASKRGIAGYPPQMWRSHCFPGRLHRRRSAGNRLERCDEFGEFGGL